MSASKLCRIEAGKLVTLSFQDASRLAAVLGLELSVRLYPNGVRIRDAGQAKRLASLLREVGRPLTYRTDMPLPQEPGQHRELRAWDSLVFGHGARTAMEFESRIMDVQATTRRYELKRRDDPVENFLLVLADTPHNRRVLEEYADLFADLPRLRTASVLRQLRNGEHPPTGIILWSGRPTR